MFIDPVLLIVWCISQRSAAAVFAATNPPLPGLQWVFDAMFEETLGMGVKLFCLSAKANSGSTWKSCC